MKVPPDEDRERRVCDTCGFIDYANPRIVTGVLAHRDGKILLCRRAIEPRKGFWTLPDDVARRLVAAHTTGRALGVLGEPAVDVLMLNIAVRQAAR